MGESRYWRDTSFRFGGNCEPQCQPETESLVKLFSVMDHSMMPEWKISWELGPVISSSPPPHRGEIELLEYSGANVIYYQTMCLPKDECSAFRIATTTPEIGYLDYSLTVDGTVLRDLRLWFLGNDTDSTINGWTRRHTDQTTYIGDCATEDICGNDESLLSVEFAVVNDHPIPDVEAEWRLSHIPTLTWALESYSSISEYNLPLGTRYKTQECLPVSGEEGCQYELGFDFFPHDGPFPLENIHVTRDGIEQPLRESYAIGGANWIDLPKRWAGFGAACYSTHSGDERGATGKPAGAIVGIIAGAIFGVAFGIV